MKSGVALALSWGITLTAASPHPELQWDPNTISTCREWFNNAGSDTCESIRSMLGISPEDFHKWNPSVGVDCKPWNYQSYCILTEEKWASYTSTHTTTKAKTTTTSSSSTHVPSPTSWNALGCYTDDDAKYPVLEKQVSSNDAALQIETCEDQCWKASNGTVLYADVKQGNQRWCGSFVGGQTTWNQTECNSPCSGNKQEICGSKGRINVFEPVTTTAKSKTTVAASSKIATITSSKTTTVTSSTTTITTFKQSSGAVKNQGIF
ncbi:uncharacterized protein TrAtP1_009161 [Trichoderma atroviride]|uniref:uncharacterized protein n=1 Tax=Hypocrea atroviridis TaxID=63577 RepID=UPI003316AE91|nr:hypothetical protein TrAtP1_009161 [Trichoderma atroviride]